MNDENTKKYKIFEKCNIHSSVIICDYAIIGKKYRKLLDGIQENYEDTIIGPNNYIGYGSIIGTGCQLSGNVIVDDMCLLESRVIIGENTLITHRAQVCNDVEIGKNCVIGGFIAERTLVGNSSRIFGRIVHKQDNPCCGWDDDESTEQSPVIKNNVFIGFDALIIGGVTLDSNSYICAGAIVTKDVPSNHIVKGINQMIRCSTWNGCMSKSKHFKLE